MTQTATVRRILPHHRVELSILRESACGHDCGSCGGCSMSGKQEVLVAADDPLGAQKGDTVVVESSSRQLLGIAALVYLLPLVLFFAGYFLGGALGWGEAGSVTAAAAGFLLGILAAVLYSRREKKRGDVLFTVTSIKG